jgi:glycosyltransferase involved in cell wall biosynthesis
MNLSGGVKMVVLHALELQRRGHTVNLVAPQYPNYDWKNRLKIKLGLKPSWSPPLSKATEGQDLWVRSKDPYRVHASDCPDADVLVCTWWETVEWVKHAGPEKGKKIHFVQGYEIFPHQPRSRVEAVYKDPMPKMVVSGWLHGILRNTYHVENIFSVPNGIDLDRYRAPESARKVYPSVGCIVSPLACKGSELAIECCRWLKQQIPELQVQLVSTHSLEACGLQSDSWMKFHQCPSLTELCQLYATQSLWLFSSREEGFGLPILEALACGTPVVAFKAGAAADIITNEAMGCVVEKKTAEALGEASYKYLTQVAHQQDGGTSSCREDVKAWSWEQSFNKMEQALLAL